MSDERDRQELDRVFAQLAEVLERHRAERDQKVSDILQRHRDLLQRNRDELVKQLSTWADSVGKGEPDALERDAVTMEIVQIVDRLRRRNH
jgi:hypothetical protein